MATYPPTLRRGLPREPGGDAWPPQGAAPVVVAAPVEPLAETAAPVVSPSVEVTDAATGAAPASSAGAAHGH